LAVELLAIGVRENKNIRGIEIGGSILKISQLADDTTCFVSDVSSIKEIFSMFKQFRQCAGLKINVDKTKARFIGSFQDREDAPLGLDWSEKNIHSLGITLSGNETDHYDLNFKKRVLNLKSLLNTWKCRKLSLKGKITVINNLALSPILYVASVIHTPNRVIKEVKSILLDYIWDGKPSKIAYDVLIQGIPDGGLKLMDFESKVKSLKAIWAKRFIDVTTHRWKAAPSLFYNASNLNLFFMSNHPPYCNIKPMFYQDVFSFWSEVKHIKDISKSIVEGQIIWYNKYLIINKKSYYWKSWEQSHILYIKDLLNSDGSFMNADEIGKKF
jgi:hypothetical protein